MGEGLWRGVGGGDCVVRPHGMNKEEERRRQDEENTCRGTGGQGTFCYKKPKKRVCLHTLKRYFLDGQRSNLSHNPLTPQSRNGRSHHAVSGKCRVTQVQKKARQQQKRNYATASPQLYRLPFPCYGPPTLRVPAHIHRRQDPLPSDGAISADAGTWAKPFSDASQTRTHNSI